MLEGSATGQFVAQYGYLAVFLGAMLEGELVVFIAGFLAFQGYLSLPLVILFGILGSMTSDQGLFFFSRSKGKQLVQKFPSLERRMNTMSERLYDKRIALTGFSFIFRYLYGLRNIAPLFLGLSSIPTSRFVLLNGIAAITWSFLSSGSGYLLAKMLAAIFGAFAKYSLHLAVLLLAMGLAWRVHTHWKRAKQQELAEKQMEDSDRPSDPC